MKPKLLLLLFTLILSLFSCKEPDKRKDTDPFSTIAFGNNSMNKVINRLMKDSTISSPVLDSTLYRYKLMDGKIKYPLLLEFNPRQFYGSSINELVINLNGDTLYFSDPIYSLGNGPRSASEINQIIEKYKYWYGEPDTVKYIRDYSKHKYSRTMEILVEEGVIQEQKNSDSIPNEYNWELDSYNLTIHLPRPSKYNPQIDSLTYKDAQIRYTVKNYMEKLKLLNDSLKVTLAPNDLITIKPGELKWSKLNNRVYQLIIPIESIGKNQLALIEDRIITRVKFDLLLTNIFNEEITRLSDFTYEIKGQLPDPGHSISNPISYTIKYLEGDEYGKLLNKAYKYSQYNTVKAQIQLSALGFKNGNILK